MAASNRNLKARVAIFSSIRSNLAASVPHDLVHGEHTAAVPLRPQAPKVLEAESVGTKIERFQRALAAVVGTSAVVHDESGLALEIERILASEGVKSVAISDAPMVQALKQRVRTSVEWIDNPSSADLFSCDLGITTAQWGIVETGTLVLESERERHRLLSLVPPMHIAILEASHILITLGEALKTLRGDGAKKPGPTITFITGPSRTSDIELVLAIGVHGPQKLHVIILDR